MSESGTPEAPEGLGVSESVGGTEAMSECPECEAVAVVFVAGDLGVCRECDWTEWPMSDEEIPA